MGASSLRFLPRSLLVSAAVAVAANGASAGAPELALAVAGRVDRVVAAGACVAVLRDGVVSLLDDRARVVGRCGGVTTTARRAPRPDGTALSAEEVLGEAGFGDEDESPEAEELLDDEGIEPRRRPRPVEASTGAARALDLAGTPDVVWIGTADGLWRLGADGAGCARVGLGGQEIARVAATGSRIVAIADSTVWRSDDAGASFDVASVLTSSARALAVAPDGTPFVADEDGVIEEAAPRGARRVLAHPTDALAACGCDVFALAEDGVYRLAAEGISRVGPRPPARALACASADGSRLVAAGVGLWSRVDGEPWVEESPGLGRSFASVAWAAGRSWGAADDGLFVTLPSGAMPAEAAPPPAPDHRGGQRPAASAAWAALLPRVALAFDGWTESTGIAGWRVWLLMTFSLNRFEVRHAARELEDFR